MTTKSIQPNPAIWHRVVAILLDPNQCLQSIKHLDEVTKRTLHSSTCNLWRSNAQFRNGLAHAIARQIQEEDELAAWLDAQEQRHAAAAMMGYRVDEMVTGTAPVSALTDAEAKQLEAEIQF